MMRGWTCGECGEFHGPEDFACECEWEQEMRDREQQMFADDMEG